MYEYRWHAVKLLDRPDNSGGCDMCGMNPAESLELCLFGSLLHVSSHSLCCPFCGLLCDDLEVVCDGGGVRLESPACSLASRLFVVPDQGQAMISGMPVSLDEAYRSASIILAGTRRPMIGGLGCDVTGHRAALALAERLGGVVDHMNGHAQFRNVRAFQDGGWVTTTLSEVRNRADLIVLAGTNASRYPRFFERCLAPVSQFGELTRKVVVLGGPDLSIPVMDGISVTSIPIGAERLSELFAVMRARLAGTPLRASELAGVPIGHIDALLADMRAARYGVLVWDAADLGFPHADLTIQSAVNLVKDLNQATRWSGLPLGGNDGGTSAAQACTWQTGYPLRIAYEAAGTRYEPLLFDTGRQLSTREVDALVWISAFDPERTPPVADCPTVVLGRADMQFEQAPDVFIPVAVPGVQHTGFLHRMDAVVALPLAAPAPSGLPSVAQALAAIQGEMNHAAA
jgi:formylmethanofuran dehydrogenase subunit B